MRTTTLALVALGLLTIPFVAEEAAALSRACIGAPIAATGSIPAALVTGTFGFVMATSCPGSLTPYHVSTAPACPAAVGPQPGEYCGPVIPAFSKAVCTWTPVLNTVPTGLYAGFDTTGDGNVFHPSGERIEGPIPAYPLAGVITNPTPFPARIIAYTTNLAGNAAAPADLNLVHCA
jgi:hypothetical protein